VLTLLIPRKYHFRLVKITQILEDIMSYHASRLNSLLSENINLNITLHVFGEIISRSALEIEALFLSGVPTPTVELVFLIFFFMTFFVRKSFFNRELIYKPEFSEVRENLLLFVFIKFVKVFFFFFKGNFITSSDL
jgi:hypothetical protein